MNRDFSFPVARIFGIQLRIHYTFFLIVLIFALGATAPGGLGVVSAMVWLVLIFICVLIHELGHSLLAKRKGATVKAIVLLPIGGVSQLENLPESPPDEFAIAIVGPLASFGLAAASAAGAVALKVPLWPPNLYDGPLLSRLAWFNLIIGAFNLIPAFPLDGGRVLRSLLQRKRPLEDATRLASRIGRVVAVVLMAIGIFYSLWLVIIGLFIFFGASSEEAATIVHSRMKSLYVRDVMIANPITVDAATQSGYLLEMIQRTSQREFPMIEGGHYAGMITADHLMAYPPGTYVGYIADRGCPAVAPSDLLEDAEMKVLGPSRRPAIAVIEEGQVVGLLTQADVARIVQQGL